MLLAYYNGEKVEWNTSHLQELLEGMIHIASSFFFGF